MAGRRKKSETFTGTGLNDEETQWGRDRFNEYCKNYHIDQLSDLQILQELVYREALQERYKRRIGEIEEANKTATKKASTKYVQDSLNSNLDNIIKLREKLGLFREKKDNDPYEYLEQLEEKFEKHRKENAGDYSLVCPHCSKMIFLMFSVKNYKATKHGFFPRGRFLTNDHLWKLYREEKLTKEDLAQVFQTSPDYVDWLAKHIYHDSDNSSK